MLSLPPVVLSESHDIAVIVLSISGRFALFIRGPSRSFINAFAVFGLNSSVLSFPTERRGVRDRLPEGLLGSGPTRVLPGDDNDCNLFADATLGDVKAAASGEPVLGVEVRGMQALQRLSNLGVISIGGDGEQGSLPSGSISLGGGVLGDTIARCCHRQPIILH